MDARVADAPSPADDRGEAVGLKAYLSGLAARLREVPPAWVRCELLALQPGPRFVRVELIEHDEGGGKLAQASGGCWPGVHRRVEDGFAALGLRLEPGTKMLVKLGARLNANFGFRVEVLDVDPAFSLGDLKAKAEAIRRRLREAGLWDANRALSRPPDFRRVAVVSPPGAAGLGDFRSTAERLARAGLVEFAFLEAAFQTREAPERIVGALRDLYRECRAGRFCAVALIRGGGAAADLAYLVDHKLAEAVCRMPVPVMTGIGHERDRTLLARRGGLPRLRHAVQGGRAHPGDRGHRGAGGRGGGGSDPRPRPGGDGRPRPRRAAGRTRRGRRRAGRGARRGSRGTLDDGRPAPGRAAQLGPRRAARRRRP